MVKKIKLPLDKDIVKTLNAGDYVQISGCIITGRDAAHKRIAELIENNKPLPVSIKGQTIYYTGPCPAPKGRVIGSCGPTTSARMDKYAPLLLENGLIGMIGKGGRNNDVIESIKNCGAVYFAAIGGAGALYSQFVKSAEVAAFDDLGAEAIFKLTVENMPLIVAIDSNGNNIYSHLDTV